MGAVESSLAGEVGPPQRESGAAPRPRRAASLTTLLVSLVATSSFLAFYRAPRSLGARSYEANGDVVTFPEARPRASLFGLSGALRLRVALPGGRLAYPLEVRGDTAGIRYLWLRAADSMPSDSGRPLATDTLVAPSEAGFYRLSLLRDGLQELVDGATLAVLVPFDQKHGPRLDGYRIGTYRVERRGGAAAARPDGFVRVTPADSALPLSRHLRVADFLARDGQTVWPRYLAVDLRVLDKLELVLERLSPGARPLATDSSSPGPAFAVHSGFRPPFYNRRVERAARDSRHQYGDAVDVAVDADGDGRVTARDARLVAKAVDSVEAAHPELVGGMGLYTSRRYLHPYVHIDARGTRARWRG